MSHFRSLEPIVALPMPARSAAFAALDKKWRKTGGKAYAKRRRSAARRRHPGQLPDLPVTSAAPPTEADVAPARWIVVLPGEVVAAPAATAAILDRTNAAPGLGGRRKAYKAASGRLLRDALGADVVDWGPLGASRPSIRAAATGDGRRRVRAERLAAIGAMVVEDLTAADVARLRAMGATVSRDALVSLPGAATMAARSQGRPDFWHLRRVGVADASGRRPDLARLDMANVLIGVLDTGAAIPGCTLSNDPIWAGYLRNGIETKSRWVDFSGHGTHVVGLIGDAVCGVAPNAKVAVCAVLTSRTASGAVAGYVSDIVRGIERMVDLAEALQRVLVLNLSLGLPDHDDALRTVFDERLGDSIVVAAIGNDGAGNNVGLYPARYAEIIAVGSVDRTGQVCAHSALVSAHPARAGGAAPPKPDIYAPGEDVWSAAPGGSYRSLSGTSMATAIASGLAALSVARNAIDRSTAAGRHASVVQTLAKGDPVRVPAGRAGPAQSPKRQAKHV